MCLEIFAEFAEKKDDYKKFFEQFANALSWASRRTPQTAS